MRKTKIVCTIGPACDSEETLRCHDARRHERRAPELFPRYARRAPGAHRPHQEAARGARPAHRHHARHEGPEYRIGTFENGKIELHSGDTFTFTTEAVTGNAERVSVSYAGLAQDLEPGDTVLVNDGSSP